MIREDILVYNLWFDNKVKILKIKAQEGEQGEHVPEIRAKAPVAIEITMQARQALCQTKI